MSQISRFFAGPHRAALVLLGCGLVAGAFSACLERSSLPDRSSPPPPLADAGAPVDDPVHVEPAAPLDAAPRVLWIRAEMPVDPARIVLVHGHAGSAQVSQVRRDEISKTLQAQLVPVTIWSDEASFGSVVIVPSEALVPGDDYTLLSGEPARATPLQVAPEDPAPLLARVWPPAGASATARYAVWCGDAALPPIDQAMELAPTGLAGRVIRGVVDGDAATNCLRFEAPGAAEITDARGQPPPSVADGNALFRLDPRPIEADAPGHPIAKLPCEGAEIAFGPGCALVADDRLTVRAPAEPALWSIAGSGIDRVLVTAASESFVVTGLAPASSATLAVVVVDDAGAAQRATVTFATLASMPHLILNEILANPLGPEPRQEWVEILNDGAMPAELGGHVLIDVGGETVLPAGTLLPGAFALIVNQAFVDADGVDPAPEPGSLVVRVPKLGHNGLSNDGEPLSLQDPSGVVISRSPVGPKTKAGNSLSRLAPAAPDAEEGSFVLAKPTPGRANAP
ncbi:MAG: lamin tail domain-containing protein [Byssovorax sp.]